MRRIKVILFAMVLAVVLAVSCAVEDVTPQTSPTFPTPPVAPEFDGVTMGETESGLLLSASLVNNGGRFTSCGFLLWEDGEDASRAITLEGVPDNDMSGFTSLVKDYNIYSEYICCAFISNGQDERRSKTASFRAVTTESVDLGLSVLWATFNVGARNPEDAGGYYQWAGLEDVTGKKYCYWDTCPYSENAKGTYWTKYVSSASPSYWAAYPGKENPDDKLVLDKDDDVASFCFGDPWRMPTYEECKELMENCSFTWTDNYNSTGVYGRIVTSNVPGYTDKSIFLPGAGGWDIDKKYMDKCGFYWTSSVWKEHPESSYVLFMNNDSSNGGMILEFYGPRCTGFSVRAVCPKE